MKGMLEMDPTLRFNSIDCLADPYFDGIRDSEVEKIIASAKGGI